MTEHHHLEAAPLNAPRCVARNFWLALTIVSLAAGCGGTQSSDDSEVTSERLVTRAVGPSTSAVAASPSVRGAAAITDSETATASASLAGRVGEPAEVAFPAPPAAPESVRSTDRLVTGEFYRLWFGDAPATVQEAPAPVSVHNLRFFRAPWVELASDGTFTVRWETVDPAPPGIAYWGVTLPDQLIETPRYRRTATEDAGAARLEHAVTANVSKIERPQYDVANLVENGGGIIEIRVEQFIPEESSARLRDVRFGYRCKSRDATEGCEEYERRPIVSQGPFVDRPAEDRYVISGTTDAEVLAAVLWDAGDGPNLAVAGGPGMAFSIPLDDVPADRRVEYRVLLLAADGLVDAGRTRWFESLPTETARFSFAVASDSRAGVGPGEQGYEGVNLAAVRWFLTDGFVRGADFFVFAGDLVDGYTTEAFDFQTQLHAWRHASELVGRYRPIFEGFGNHEALMNAYANGTAFARGGNGSPEAIFSSAFVNPANGPPPENEHASPYGETVYSWDVGNAHFVMLNSNYWWSNLHDADPVRPQPQQNREGYIMDGQLAWLDDDLAAARAAGAEHIFVFTHEPVFPNAFHRRDAMYWDGEIPAVLERRNELVRTVMRHDVLAIFTGDEHNYNRMLVDERIDESYDGSLWSIITGGCGAPFYAQEQVPWTPFVEVFTAQQNYVLVDVDGSRVTATVIGGTGEIIDEIELTARAPR